MSSIQFLKTEMGIIANEARIPELHQDKVDQTINVLETYAGHDVLWLVHPQGATIMPIGVGSDPSSVAQLLWRENHTVTAYRIDTCDGYLERISHSAAESMAYRYPVDLFSLTPVSELIEQVNQVLIRGCKLRLWGGGKGIRSVCEVIDWVSWHAFFKNNDANELMTSFMDKAIHFRAIRIIRDLDTRVAAKAA